MNYNQLKNRHFYLYLYMTAPLLFPVTHYLIENDIATSAAPYIFAWICMYLDQKRLFQPERVPKTELINPTIMTVIFPPAYVYWRAVDEGMKKWRWFFLSLAIGLGSGLIYINMAEGDSVKVTACEITTSIYQDKNLDVKCLAVEGVKKISERHYRAKAILSNGIDMPIIIEEKKDGYVYVTLAPLSDLFD